MPTLHAYLSFNGNCADAMHFYEQALGAKLQTLIRYRDAPPDMPAPPGHEDKVMHALLVHPGFQLMAGDAPPGMPYAPRSSAWSPTVSARPGSSTAS